MVAARLRRGTGTNEMHVAERRGLRVGRGEGQPTRVQAGPHQLAEPGLVDGQVPGRQLAYLLRISVHAKDPEPEAGQASGVSDAQVPGAEHGEPQRAIHHAARWVAVLASKSRTCLRSGRHGVLSSPATHIL